MSDFFSVLEIIKNIILDTSSMIYYRPFVYSVKVSVSNSQMESSYFITTYNAINQTNNEILNIQNIIINIVTNYSRKTSVLDCVNDEESFYFDINNQVLYVHFNHLINPKSLLVEYGKTFGYTSDKVREFNGLTYDPLVLSIPNMDQRVDPLQYSKIAFFGGNINTLNAPVTPDNNGTFDNFEQVNGNDANVLYGSNDDAYSDLIGFAKFYIENYVFDFNVNNIKVKDKREQSSITIPFDKFNDTDYPDIDTELIGKIKPDGYGTLKGVPGICVNSGSAGAKQFYFCSTITGTPDVYAKKDNKWTAITPDSIDGANGIITIAVADAHVDGNNTKGLNDIKADGTFINYSNPGDIIKDLNLRFLGLEYDSSNYNTTEFAAESGLLADIGLYIDEEKDIYEYIQDIQNSSTVGFQYFIDYGLRTIRLDNPNRDPVKEIQAVDILNNANIPTDKNATLFATNAVIFYNKDYTEDTFDRVENNEFETEVFREHRIYKQYSTESKLIAESDAEDKASIIMDDQKTVRPIWDIVLFGKEYFTLRIFDIITAVLSYPGKLAGYDETDLLRFTDDDLDDVYIFDDSEITGTTITLVFVDYTKREVRLNARDYFGLQRGQIIGLDPNFEEGTIKVTIRQRDYSGVFESITGYTP